MVYPAICVLMGGIMNTVLDYLLVAVFPYGIKGAAFATGISQLTSTSMLLYYVLFKTKRVKFTKIKYSFLELIKISKVGFAEFLAEVSTGIAIFVFNLVILKSLGEKGVSAFGVIGYISSFVVMTMIGFSQGIQPIVSFNLGAKKYDNVIQTLKISLIMIIITGAVFYGGINLFADKIIHTFLNDPDTFSLTKYALVIYSFAYIINGLNIVTAGYFTAIKKVDISTLITVLRGENGYRYYSQKQLWKLNNIRNLRNLGVSLEMITNFLNDRSMEKTKTVINFQLTKINEQLKKLLSLKEELEEKKKNIEYFENFSHFETPIIKEIDDRYVLFKEGHFKEEEEIDFELKKLKRLNFEDNDFIFTESEIGATIKLENWKNENYFDYNSTFIITTDKTDHIIPKGTYLTFTFKGSYENVIDHYKNLKNFITNNNLTVIGDIIEIYHIEIHITDNIQEYITEIQIPVIIS
jgi:effector-binding domain-containing protein